MTDGAAGRRQRLVSLYVAWIVVFGLAFGAGGYTLGFLVDDESLGTANDPNRLRAAGNFGPLEVGDCDPEKDGGGSWKGWDDDDDDDECEKEKDFGNHDDDVDDDEKWDRYSNNGWFDEWEDKKKSKDGDDGDDSKGNNGFDWDGVGNNDDVDDGYEDEDDGDGDDDDGSGDDGGDVSNNEHGNT